MLGSLQSPISALARTLQAIVDNGGAAEKEEEPAEEAAPVEAPAEAAAEETPAAE